MQECVTSEKCMRIGEFAKRVSLSVSTVKKYESLGIIKPHHKSGLNKQRYYTDKQVEDYIQNYQIVD